MMILNLDNALMYVLAGFAGLIGAVIVMIRPRSAIWLLGLMVVSASIGVVLDWQDNIVATFWYPLQARRSHLFVAAGTLLLVAALAQYVRRIPLRLDGVSLAVLAIGLFASLMRLAQGNAAEGAVSFAFTLATILPAALVIPTLLRRKYDFHGLARMLLWTHVLWLGLVVVQFVVNPNHLRVEASGRFYGLTANPQHAAAYLSIVICTSVWLILNETHSRYRPLWIVLVGIDAILLGWTGSRTGLLMCLTGGSIVLLTRVGRSILLLPILAIAVFVAAELAAQMNIGLGLERLVSTENTRMEAWLRLIGSALRNPLVGVGTDDALASENSYLYGFASYGMGMVVLMALLIALSVKRAADLYRHRGLMGPLRPVMDIVIAFYAMYFIGALFEGYIVQRVGVPLIAILMFNGLGYRLLRLARGQDVLEDLQSRRYETEQYTDDGGTGATANDEADITAEGDGHGSAFDLPPDEDLPDVGPFPLT